MTLQPVEFKDELDQAKGFILLDVRPLEDFSKSRISKAIWAGTTEVLDSVLTGKPLDTPVFVYCERGNRSKEVVLLLSKRKVKIIYELEGGFMKWEQQKLPVEKRPR